MLTALSAKEFNTAFQRGLLTGFLNLVRGRSNALLSFTEIKEQLGLQNGVDRGLQEIEIDKIVGSTSRRADFSRSFYPIRLQMEDRWRSIDELYHQRGFPPINVVKVGGVYFVQDGHHRVSVNRLHNVPTIEARVIEYDTPLSLEDGCALEQFRTRAGWWCALDELQRRLTGRPAEACGRC